MAATNSNPNNQDEYGMAEKIRDGVVNMIDKMGQDEKNAILQALNEGQDEKVVSGMLGAGM